MTMAKISWKTCKSLWIVLSLECCCNVITSYCSSPSFSTPRRDIIDIKHILTCFSDYKTIDMLDHYDEEGIDQRWEAA